MSRSAAILTIALAAVTGAAHAGETELLEVSRQTVAAGDSGVRTASLERAYRRGSLEPRRAHLLRGYASHLVRLINDYRDRRGLPALEISEDLTDIATEHSASMAQRGRISHDGFRARFDQAGSRLCVENVGWNFPHAEAQLHGWRASPGHHRNLLDPKVRRVGIAIQKSYVTYFACS